MEILGVEIMEYPLYEPQTNSVAKRWNSTLLDADRCAMVQANYQHNMWHWAVIDVSYKYDLLPHSVASSQSIKCKDENAKTKRPKVHYASDVKVGTPTLTYEKKIAAQSGGKYFLFHDDHRNIKDLSIWSTN